MRLRTFGAVAACAGMIAGAGGCTDKKDPAAPLTAARDQTPHDTRQPAAVGSDATALPAGAQIARSVTDELTNLAAGESLASWRKRHPSDGVEFYSPSRAEAGNAPWCARATSKAGEGASAFQLRAYFYVPEPPTPLALPDGMPAEQLRERCRLGLLWEQVDDVDASRADALADAVRGAMTSAIGQGESVVTLAWAGSAGWRKTGLWKRNAVTIVTGASSDGSGEQAATPATHTFAAAVRPAPGRRFERAGLMPAERDMAIADFQEHLARIDEARKMAMLSDDVDAAVRAAQRMLVEEDGSSRTPTLKQQTDLYAAIDRWLMASRAVPAERKSAALFVADQLIDLAGGPFWEHGRIPPVAARLEKQGARFEWRELGGIYVYTHTWLKEARRLDPDGPAGQQAFLTLMEKGFETSGACLDQRGEGFRAVIDEGEAFLRRSPTSSISADVHLLVSEAYLDIVSLANGGGVDPEANRSEYQPQAANARAKSLEHLTAALAAGRSEQRFRDAWPDAWRLLADLSGTTTHFYCVYD